MEVRYLIGELVTFVGGDSIIGVDWTSFVEWNRGLCWAMKDEFWCDSGIGIKVGGELCVGLLDIIL